MDERIENAARHQNGAGLSLVPGVMPPVGVLLPSLRRMAVREPLVDKVTRLRVRGDREDPHAATRLCEWLPFRLNMTKAAEILTNRAQYGKIAYKTR